MENKNFTTSFMVDQSPKEAFDAINNVCAWWTENLEGDSRNLLDTFSVKFGDVHYSKQELVEVIPYIKVVWLVTDSKLTFVKDQNEWIGNRIIFEITKRGNQTQVSFSQSGLTPEVECFDACSNVWGDYINGSLRSLITTGKGKPTKKEPKNILI